MEDTDILQLGGNIELSGFSVLDSGEMIIVKKIVGNYVRKIEGMCRNFTGLKLRMKPLHQTGDKLKRFELSAQVHAGSQVYPANITEYNLFVGLDSVMKKLVNEIN